MPRIRLFFYGLLFLTGLTMTVQTEEVEFFSLNVAPGLTIPLGANSDLYNLGGGALISGNFAMPFFQPLRFTTDIGYNIVPISNTVDSLSLFSFGAGVGINYSILPGLDLYANGKAGYFFASLNDGSGNNGSNPWIHVGVGAAYRILPFLSVGIGGAYRHYSGLYSDTGITLGMTYHFGTVNYQKQPKIEKPKLEMLEGDGLDITDLEFTSIFPVFYSYYDNNPVGKVVLFNFEKQSVEDISLTFYVKQYMDNPKKMATPDNLDPQEQAEVDILGLFTSDILDVTEGEKVSALINLTYTVDGEEKTKEFVESITVNNRNALTWDDDRKVCAFVTAKDPAVMRFAKNVSSYIRGIGSRATNRNLQQAMALHEALDIFGISYIIDPTTPYEELSQNATVIDFLQFPNQTLEFKGGDCDDLSALYAALLESLGIETAFITIPGHIYMAFSLDITPEEAREQFDRPDNLIFEQGKVWLPVEITLRDEGFMRSWQVGAKEWRENKSKDQAQLYSVREGWKTFKPVGFPGTPDIDYPEKNNVAEAFIRTEKIYINQEIMNQAAELQAKIDSSQGNMRLINKLGILYATYGFDDDALTQFEKVIELKTDYYPAMINIGNIYYLQDDIETALIYYQQAEQVAPEKPTVLLSLSRTNHKLENYYGARQAYDKLKEVSPGLADRFSYLDLRGEEADRASKAGDLQEVMIWAEE